MSQPEISISQDSPHPPSKHSYSGHRTPTGTEVLVFTSGDPIRVDPLPLRLDLADHSPTGFEWGYTGSGPAQLSLAILAHCLGDDQRALGLYQVFKSDVIVHLPHSEWSIPDTAVREWVEKIESVSKLNAMSADMSWLEEPAPAQVDQNAGGAVDADTGEIGLNHLVDDELLVEYERASILKKSWTDQCGALEMEIRRRIKASGGSIIPSNDFQCELLGRASYEQARFTPLKEVFTEADLASCLVPAHEETTEVADKWNTNRVKSLARRYGTEAQRIFDAAAVPQDPRFVFKRKGE